MIKLKNIHLQNYCGYQDTKFDFLTKENDPKILSVFFGENGTGKTSVLEAINMLCLANRFENMDTSLLFRKLTYHQDYNPVCIDDYTKSKDPMIITGLFTTDNGDKEVILHSDKGVVKNELPYDAYGHSYYIDADNPLNMYRFQLDTEMSDIFIEMSKIVYNYECEIIKPSFDMDESFTTDGQDGDFYTNFIINKNNGTRVHFKRMSAGEKKIATLLSSLCHPEYMNNIDIVIIDNVLMHIYFKRHLVLIKKILELFKDKQFFVTTHSGLLVEKLDEKYLYDIDKIKSVAPKE